MRVLIVSLILAGSVLAGPRAEAADIFSYAFVNDDGTLRIRGKTIRLYGIHIPDTGRTCKFYVNPPACGPRAVVALEFNIGSHFVRCTPVERTGDGVVVGVCRVEGRDLAAQLVEQGWALARPDAPFEYRALEKIARHHHRGAWGIPVDQIRPRR